MLMDVLIATVIGSLSLMGLFVLTEETLKANQEVRALAVGHRALIDLEAHWRLGRAAAHDGTLANNLTCVNTTQPWLQAWCGRTREALAALGYDSILCLEIQPSAITEVTAQLLLGAADCDALHDGSGVGRVTVARRRISL